MNDTQTKAPPITIRIPADLLEQLRIRAKAEDRSLASLIVSLNRQGMMGWVSPPGPGVFGQVP